MCFHNAEFKKVHAAKESGECGKVVLNWMS